jgi:photosynthetic reaction center cytochrome c subunit
MRTGWKLTRWVLLASLALSCVPLGGQTTESTYKNIQVLKGIPADQLIPSMQFMSSSLGVHCNHCHVEGAFEKDDKKAKQQARQMMQMVASLNKKDLSGGSGVTCYSCHRGTLRPRRIPVVKGENATDPVEPSVPGTDAAAISVLTRCLRATGGQSALQTIKSEVKSGVVELGPGLQFKMQVMMESPRKRREVVHFNTGDSVDIVNGDTGWSAISGRPTRVLPKAEAEILRQAAEPEFLALIRSSFKEFRTSPDQVVGGRQTSVIRVSNPDEAPVRLFIDKETGLLLRIVRYVDSPLGRNPTEIDFSDYRDVAGTKQPFHWKVTQPEGGYSVQLSKIEVNVPIEDSMFSSPENLATSK